MAVNNMMLDVISNSSQFLPPTNQIHRAPRQYIERNREEGHERLFNDYFSNNPLYPDHIFRRRFRMRKHVFMRLVDTITSSDNYFQQTCDASGRLSLSPLQKCTTALRVLAYGTSADSIDEYMRMSPAVPNEEDLARLLCIGEHRGFPGMLGSIYCMHWEWKNCPTAWAGQYAVRNKKCTIILEAVASQDLWIWHAFFGTPGSCNDINVLQRSPVFNDILEGVAPEVNFTVNGNQYNMGYYLTDGIYPSWATFVKFITAPQLRKHKLFAQCQESARKDVERAFGVLQARFAFIKRPCLVWDRHLMGKILIACIIMHNMIVEDERDTFRDYFDPAEFCQEGGSETSYDNYQFSNEVSSLATYMQNRSELRSRETHIKLKNDLIEHVAQKFGGRN